MGRGTPSRERLDVLVALAQSYRDLSTRQVAELLGRDIRNLIPASGKPKMDLVVSLASMLDWPVEMAIDELYASSALREMGSGEGPTRARANRAAWDALVAERWDETVVIATTTLESSAPDLDRAAEQLRDHVARGTMTRDRALAEIAGGGALEMRAMLGVVSPAEATSRFLEKRDGTEELARLDSHEIEALGWRCILGANVVLRHVQATHDAEQLLASFTNKAEEIAIRPGRWALRERVFAIEHRCRSGHHAPIEEPPTLDKADLQTLAGTMARLPTFRPTGWQTLPATARTTKGGGE